MKGKFNWLHYNLSIINFWLKLKVIKTKRVRNFWKTNGQLVEAETHYHATELTTENGLGGVEVQPPKKHLSTAALKKGKSKVLINFWQSVESRWVLRM